MAHHEMRDHRQAPAWPPRPLPSDQRHVERDAPITGSELFDGMDFAPRRASLVDADAELLASRMLVLDDIEIQMAIDEELAAAQAEFAAAGRACRLMSYRWECAMRVVRREVLRRSELTAHQRIIENARRREQRGDLA